MKLADIQHTTLKDQVVRSLRKAILYGDIKPGQQITQQEIAEKLNISRMPVREAFAQLETEGLIKNVPYKGSIVAKLTKEDIREIYEMRNLTEGFAAELAIKNMKEDDIKDLENILNNMHQCLKREDVDSYVAFDRTFHYFIFEKSGNRRLIRLIKNIWESFPMYIAYSMPKRIEKSFQEHDGMLKAIMKKDSKTTAYLVRKQIDTVYAEMVPHFEDH